MIHHSKFKNFAIFGLLRTISNGSSWNFKGTPHFQILKKKLREIPDYFSPTKFLNPKTGLTKNILCTQITLIFFIRNVCSGWGSRFLKLSTFEPIFFLNFSQFEGEFSYFFLIFWCFKAIFSYFSNILQKYVTQGFKIDLIL